MRMEKKVISQSSRELQALHTKAMIFKAAIALFRERDYTQVTINDITNAAGVAKGTFYLYFKTKEEILAKQFADMDTHYKKAAANLPKEPLDQQLLYFLCQMFHYCQDVCGLNIMKTLYTHQISIELRSKFLNNTNRPFYLIMTQFVHEGHTNGLFCSARSETEILETLLHSVHGVIYDWCLYNGEFDLEKEGRRYLQDTIDFLKA